MDYKDTKNAEIKIRITKQKKEELQKLAIQHKMTLSTYVLSKCLSDTDDWLQLIPDAVETWNAYSEIFRLVTDTQNKQLIDAVRNIIDRCNKQTSNENGGNNHA